MAFTRKQWLTIITFVVVNFCNAMCVSMQAPFYPREAVKKGLQVWHFGLVFGAFEITVFIVSPIIGTYLNVIGVKRTLNVGIGFVGIILVLYGCLGMIQNGKIFLGLSFVLRIFEACGNSAFLTGSFSAIANEFPDKVASMFAMIELFFGIGEIVGPVVGGALYEIGGFTLPFAVMGSILFLSSIFIYFVLPDTPRPPQCEVECTTKPTMRNALTKPAILIALFKVASAAASLGFLQTTLEPHLHDIKPPLSSFQVGALFMVVGGTYGISLPLWGFLCDSPMTRNSPKFVEVCGAILITTGFLVLGPFKYFPFKKTLVTVIVGMTIHGFGLGASVVGGFSDAHKSAIKAGFPDTIDTYGLVSGLWTSVFAFGAFVGPTFGGLLYDAVTFRWAIFLVIITEVISFICLVSYLSYDYCCKPSQPYDRVPSSVAPTTTDAEEDKTTGYGAIGDGGQANGRNLLVPNQGVRNRKYSESVGRSYVASAIARNMSVTRNTGFASAGLGSAPRRGGEEDSLIA